MLYLLFLLQIIQCFYFLSWIHQHQYTNQHFFKTFYFFRKRGFDVDIWLWYAPISLSLYGVKVISVSCECTLSVIISYLLWQLVTFQQVDCTIKFDLRFHFKRTLKLNRAVASSGLCLEKNVQPKLERISNWRNISSKYKKHS